MGRTTALSRIGIDQATAVGEELVATGRSSYPVIGASVTTAQDGSGVLLQEVTPGGPAAAAGLSAGDVVTAVNGQPVTEQVELIVKIRAERPGDEITLNIQGRGEVRVVLGGVQE